MIRTLKTVFFSIPFLSVLVIVGCSISLLSRSNTARQRTTVTPVFGAQTESRVTPIRREARNSRGNDDNVTRQERDDRRGYPNEFGAHVTREIIHYPAFNITEPNFLTEGDRSLFYLNADNARELGVPSSEKLVGEIYTVRNGTFGLPYDCGFKSDVEFVKQSRKVDHRNWYHVLLPLVVPGGHTFQHFLDGTLPKLVQALPLVQKLNAKILIKKPRDAIVYEFLEMMNITRDRLVFIKKGGAYGANNLLFACNTPPVHPVLWSKARTLLGAPEYRQVSRDVTKVIVVTRNGCYNCGRRILNLDKLVDVLSSNYGRMAMEVFKGPFNLKDTLNLFGKAQLVIGTHGGGMYNINFCPRNTTVVEIMPQYRRNGRQIAGAPTIIWLQAVLLGHNFWRLPTEPANSKGDVVVNVDQVQTLINRIRN